ncbi:MAG: small basic protein [Candidatus Omnitrophica bacterium]|nr:small basic protein [Candidatus Omnitrophota bacterium]
MSQHPSLRSSEKDKQHRSVLKRYERLKVLKDKEKWNESGSVFGLPKVKVLRFKIKKEKAVKEAEGAEAIAAAPGSEPAAGTAPKAAPSKTAPAKESTKTQGAAQQGKEPKK